MFHVIPSTFFRWFVSSCLRKWWSSSERRFVCRHDRRPSRRTRKNDSRPWTNSFHISNYIICSIVRQMEPIICLASTVRRIHEYFLEILYRLENKSFFSFAQHSDRWYCLIDFIVGGFFRPLSRHKLIQLCRKCAYNLKECGVFLTKNKKMKGKFRKRPILNEQFYVRSYSLEGSKNIQIYEEIE